MSDNQELRHWRERFSETAELLPGIICEIDLSLKLTYVNRAGFECFGYTQADFDEGVYLNGVIHPDDHERGLTNFAKVLTGQRVEPREYRLVHKDGAVIEYQVNSSPIFEEDKVVGIRTCLFDISARKRAERQLRESEERFRRIFSQSPIGVALVVQRGELVDANEAFREMFGLPEDQGAGEPLPGLFDIVALDREHRQLITTGSVSPEGDALHLDSVDSGSIDAGDRYLEWHLTPLGAAEDGSTLLLVQVQDVTERKRAEQAELDEARAAAESARQLVANLRREVQKTYSFHNMVSRSGEMQKIFEVLPQIAGATTNVLIRGDSGTGKELIARSLHELGPRREKPFVAINCSALPDSLLESELFGYKAGAFTDAKKDKPGKFAQAEGGVLFLDEIGDVSPAMQVKLLRVLQERVYEPLGGTTGPVQADVRVIAASHRDLPEMVKEGAFREDLFYRLNVLKITLPPLRDRRSDIPLLSAHFVEKLNQRFNKSIAGISQEALDRLLVHDFPGNIRELENIIEHAFVFCGEGEIQLDHLPEEVSTPAGGCSQKALARFNSLDELEAQYIKAVLEDTGGNRREAARRLGIHKSTLFRKLKKHGIA